MEILQVLPSIASESGGPVRSTLATCRALHRVDPAVRFTVATTGRGLEPQWRHSLEAELPPGTKLVVFRAVGRHAFSFSFGLVAWLRANVARFDLVVVRALLHPISSAAAWTARWQDVPYVVVPHGTLSRYTFTHRRSLLKKGYFVVIDRHTVAGAAAVRFTSRAEQEEAPGWGTPTPTRVIPHPYEPRFGSEPARDGKLRQILFLSRLHPKKGVDVLIEAVRQVLGDVPDARLVLAGSGTSGFEGHVRSLIHRWGLEKEVELPGFVEGEDKARLLSESAVFALPSLQENFGVVVAEAMDAGVPVVISRGVDIWPAVGKAGAGIVLHERTPAAVARALVRLLTDEPLRRQMGRNGRELVRNEFDPEAVGRQVSQLYRTAAEGRRRAPGR